MRDLTLGDVHCEVDTLVNILSLVGHPKGVYLRLDEGYVLEVIVYYHCVLMCYIHYI